MKVLLIKILTITLLFRACSLTSVYNLSPKEAILCPVSEDVYIHKQKYKKDLKIIQLNDQSPSFSFTDNLKIPIGETTFLIRSYSMNHMHMAKIKFDVLDGNGMTFVIKSEGKVILEEEGVRKF